MNTDQTTHPDASTDARSLVWVQEVACSNHVAPIESHQGVTGSSAPITPSAGIHSGIRYRDGMVVVVCSACSAEYTISPDTARRPQRNVRLCVRCRSLKGLANGALGRAVTPESTKAERIRANGIVNSRKKRGAFTAPPSCMKCAKPKRRLDSHHTDYSKPDEVFWLCRSCHMKAHRDATFLDGLTPVVVPRSAPSPAPSRVALPAAKGGEC